MAKPIIIPYGRDKARSHFLFLKYQKLLTIPQNWGTLDVEFVWTTALFIKSIHAESIFDGCPVFLEFVTVVAFECLNTPILV